MPRTLSIPPGEENILLEMANWSEEEFDRFKSAIAKQSGITSSGAFANAIVKETTESSEQDSWAAAASTIMGIASALNKTGSTQLQAADDLSLQLVRNENLSADLGTRFRERLSSILTQESVLTTAQADMFLSLRGNLLRRAEVNTQLEPLYASSENRAKPTGFLILQELAFEARTSNDEQTVTFSCFVDDEDLRGLQEQIREALLRKSHLDKMLSSTKFMSGE